MQDDVATPSKAKPQRQLQRSWLSRITKEEKAHAKIRKRMDDVYAVWKEDLKQEEEIYVPLWWSVVEIEHTGVYSSQPIPDCRPRNELQNPAYKTAARVLERGLSYCVDDQSFDDCMHQTVDDFLGVGLGVPRVKLDSIIVNHWTGDTNPAGIKMMEEQS